MTTKPPETGKPQSASPEHVKKLLTEGGKVAEVATQTGWSRSSIIALINGWPGWRYSEQSDTAVRTTRPAKTGEEVGHLLAEAAHYADDAAVRRALDRARAALDKLRQTLELRREVLDAEAEIAALERQLAEAKARMRKLKGTPPAPDRGLTKAIRKWAADNGISVPPRGRIPAAVVAQYQAAHGGQE